ncbi:hypothetical protein [Paraburkholderia sp. GAS42]|uniref:hypothetical protein n=1 Tax=Paraburkholderia sp. GAS42 TaxID=3035135 RepID=UPI003D1EE3F5
MPTLEGNILDYDMLLVSGPTNAGLEKSLLGFRALDPVSRGISEKIRVQRVQVRWSKNLRVRPD